MRITKDKKKQILADKDQLSINEISKKYNLPRSQVKNIIKASEKKPAPKWFFAVLVLIPILFFVLLEIGLRVFNYGYDMAQWVDAGRGKYLINPEIAKRYFSTVKNIPTTIEDTFDQQKKENSFRVFVLGGSSAAGYPYMPMGSFSRYIRRRLELTYPNTTIEVVNISMTAVNTYTLLDLLPGVLEQKPDLVLIYAGHNEYYGALGVGSMESLGTSRSFVNLMLHLDKYKVTQLVRNSLNWFLSLFASKNKEDLSGTLMSRMAKDQYIPLNSDKFNAGLEQFEGNLQDILTLCKDRGVPVILGRLVSNLKDQKPFISVSTPNYKTANQVFLQAQNELKNSNIHEADSLFKLAKDLDALRFRAPEKMNAIINKLSKEFHTGLVPVDSLFDDESPEGIAGNNLIVDHLHPNIKGYELIGKAYYEAMEKTGNLPKDEKPKIPFEMQDSLTQANFEFTQLDSIIGNNKIRLLKNDWPFIERGKNLSKKDLFKPENFIDSIALKCMEDKISWSDAHINAAAAYLRRNDVNGYLSHMDILIYQYPIVVEYYDQTALVLLNRKDYKAALKYLLARYKMEPSGFSAKWIGTVSLFNKKYDDAIIYLNKSHELDPNDTQVLYNLAGAYSQKKNYQSALNAINQCLGIDPKYPQANNLKQQLLTVINGQQKK